MTKPIIGIDPGKQGALCWWNEGEALEFFDPLLLEDGSYDRKGMLSLLRHLASFKPIAGIEVVHPHPGAKSGAVGAFSMGYGAACWHMALDAAGIDFIEVRSEDWRRMFDLAVKVEKAGKRATDAEKAAAKAKRKQVSLSYARQEFCLPFATPRGRDLDGQAEAAIISKYTLVMYARSLNK